MHIDRYAPSPTSDLHLGNLRTALAGWLLARVAGGQWLMRVEDLDEARVRAAGGAEARQLADLRALGLTWDGPVVRQSERLELYRQAVAALGGRVYECFCTRREIAEAASAPHGDDGYRPYPGTCRRLSERERAERRATRPAALRVRGDGASFTIQDAHAGEVTGIVDDFVLVRADGTPAYNLAVVVDDIAMGVTHITRGDDLLSSAPRQAWLTEQLGGSPARYAHVGLVLGPDGKRLAKRDGAVTLAEAGGPAAVFPWLAESLGLGPCRNVEEALAAMPGESLFERVVWRGQGFWTSSTSIT
ncbi:tRNA glutamyl-Q(34) synthetase GluQRS [Tessaracoccus oleiagri]|uniref:Glutamyl-Q tRNA(Asp) synthetase n=1 Tax=Tessaracoccus oleiagri TaxID=686624 RepID=A0A1G9L410_9ACTN|nr:tRNA glutamyl-Q(34) synthetase GluQRS [Tessaracoccus oleiagri]SDL56493.1 glutamyl-tRNA synthetase [Tessaracoccus oleiagri]